MVASSSTYTLAQVIALALQEQGLVLLEYPKRLVAYVTDLASDESRDVHVFAVNCDESFLAPYVRAAREGTPEAVEWAAHQAEALLTENRFLVEDVSRDVTRAVACAVAHVMRVPLSAGYGSAAIPYDVFVCCREVVEPTGVRTNDGTLAMNVSNALSRAGLRVFYPRISLVRDEIKRHDALTQEALDIAKVLLIVCSDVEYLRSAWVLAQLQRFRSTHARAHERTIVCTWGHDATRLPSELQPLLVMEATGEELPDQVMPRIMELAKAPLDIAAPSAGESSLGTVRPEWATTNDLRYREHEALTEEGRVLMLVLRPVKLEVTDVIVTFRTGGSVKTSELKGLCAGDEGLMVLDGASSIISVQSKRGGQSQRLMVQRLAWRPTSLLAGKLLRLSIWNHAQRTSALSNVTLLVEGNPCGVVRLGSQGILLAGETKTLTIQLNEWSANMLGNATSYDLYVFGRKVPRV